MDTNMEENKLTNNKKATYWFVGGIILAIAIYSGYYIWQNNINLSPEEQSIKELKQLAKTSEPITKTPEERLSDLEELSKNSDPVTYTQEERLKMLESLNK